MRTRPAHHLLVVLSLALAACGGGTGASPSVAPEKPAPTPVMPVASAPVVTPASSVAPTEPEAALLHGARLDLQGKCAPLRTDLPANATGAIECTTASDAAARVTMTMFDTQAQLLEAYDVLVAAHGIEPFSNGGRCEPIGPSEGAYVPGDGHGERPAERGACWPDQEDVAHYIATSSSFVLLQVDGRPGTTISGTERFAWLGNQDQPGGPTLWATEPMSPEK
jgi:hypothetical protein